ncbi:MAG: hypothetical protein PHT41_04265 [Candidatus Omnitrophica bacterium]|nr:hypothetical protein [Candidatus Omnitrophota bacterium]MDD5237546.1 hypothetical protein [Candidatus Omnitrophota bacterium]
MLFNFSSVNLINLSLCIVVLVLGYMSYKKNKNKIAIYISVAFGLFGFSHLMTLFEFGTDLESILIIIRILAYLLVIVALYKTVFKD